MQHRQLLAPVTDISDTPQTLPYMQYFAISSHNRYLPAYGKLARLLLITVSALQAMHADGFVTR
jgi:hypothetical protein